MPDNEQTPLLQTVVVAPPTDRYSHKLLRRICTSLLSVVLVVIIILFLVPATSLPWNRPGRDESSLSAYSTSELPTSRTVGYDELQQILLDAPQEASLRDFVCYYTSGQHLAGKNISQALWTRDLWNSLGIQSQVVDYDVYLNYPLDHRVALLEKPASEDATMDEFVVKYECNLEEDVLSEDPSTGAADRVPTFNGYSATGNVTAQYVFVNFGTYEDFEQLGRANIALKGKIAIAKYGKCFRGLKVKRAQELGMVGVVLYTDPEEDGEMTEAHGFKTYPNGTARNPSSVQRGSVQDISTVAGDPTTPGYPSKPGVPRIDPNYTLPHIPSQPISYREAIPLLKALNGHGPKASVFGDHWTGGQLGYRGVEYNIGPSPASLLINLLSTQNYVTTPIWDVTGIINGTIPDEVLVIGGHRDAWISGGAGDPNGASSILNEIIKSFSQALARGWKPLRTIVFTSWDGEEYGLLGSTEWTEEFAPWLSKAAIAYLNLDTAVTGSHLGGAASPLLGQALCNAAALVKAPNASISNQTMRDTWSGSLAPMGSGSDFVPFQDFLGIPSTEMAYFRTQQDPVYQYHSNFDSFTWMDRFGDPGWHRHKAMTQFFGLLAASLADQPVLEFNTTQYAVTLRGYLDAIHTAASTSPSAEVRLASDFPSLARSLQHLAKVAAKFDAHAAAVKAAVSRGVPRWRWWDRVRLYRLVRRINHEYKYFERKFLYAPGLDGRPLFKHVVFAPGLWDGYAGKPFPGLVEAVDRVDVPSIVKWENVIRGCVERAADSLAKATG